MSKYLVLNDVVDPALVITESHLESADVYVDLALQERNIKSDDVVLPNTILSEIASAWAKREAAIEGAIGENSTLLDKARQFEKTAEMLVKKISKKALGVDDETSAVGYGTATIGRG